MDHELSIGEWLAERSRNAASAESVMADAVVHVVAGFRGFVTDSGWDRLELVSDCFNRVCKDDFALIRRYDSATKVESILSGVVRLLVLERRSTHRRHHRFTSKPTESIDSMTSPLQPTPSTRMDHSQFEHWVSKLSPRQKEVVSMWATGHSIGEIAGVLGMKWASANSILKGGITSLKRQISHNEAEQGP